MHECATEPPEYWVLSGGAPLRRTRPRHFSWVLDDAPDADLAFFTGHMPPRSGRSWNRTGCLGGA